MIRSILFICILWSLLIPSYADNNQSEKDMSNAFFALQLKHSLFEKYKLLTLVEDQRSKRIIGCSIVKETNDLISYVELDAPKIIVDKEILSSIKAISDKEKRSLEKSRLNETYKCDDHIKK